MKNTSGTNGDIIPYPTGRTFGARVSRHFVPGYLHSVPTGRDPFGRALQAFHGTLRLISPYGTIVLGLIYLAIAHPLRASEENPAALPQPLDIRVQANVFGKASAADITMVLRSAGEELFRYCPHTQLDGIDVYYRGDHPEIDLHRTREGRIAFALSARDTRWAQYSFQFAHEFCHALANFADHSQPTVAKLPNPNLWFEESLCETASLFVLRAMSRSWATHPPYPAWRTYARWLNDYIEQRLTLRENRLPIGTSFSAWFRENQTALRRDADQRARNIVIATQLLPIFEADPAGWEAVTFLNRGSSSPEEPLSKHFDRWRTNCPDRLRPFVTRLAHAFGITLK